MHTRTHFLPATNNRREDARECFVDERHHHESSAIVAGGQNRRVLAIDTSVKVCSHHPCTVNTTHSVNKSLVLFNDTFHMNRLLSVMFIVMPMSNSILSVMLRNRLDVLSAFNVLNTLHLFTGPALLPAHKHTHVHRCYDLIN